MNIIAKYFLNLAKSPYTYVVIIALLAVVYHMYAVSSLNETIVSQSVEISNKDQHISALTKANDTNQLTIKKLKGEIVNKDKEISMILSNNKTQVDKLKALLNARPVVVNHGETVTVDNCKVKIYSEEDINGTDVIFDGIKHIGF